MSQDSVSCCFSVEHMTMPILVSPRNVKVRPSLPCVLLGPAQRPHSGLQACRRGRLRAVLLAKLLRQEKPIRSDKNRNSEHPQTSIRALPNVIVVCLFVRSPLAAPFFALQYHAFRFHIPHVRLGLENDVLVNQSPQKCCGCIQDGI